MCDKCQKLDQKIARYLRILERVLDPLVAKGVSKLIEEAEAEKAALHPVQKEARATQGYRAYIVRPDGHIQYRIDLVCKDEAAAKKHAKALVADCDVELWQLDKFIKRFEREDGP
jgi:hypothetical protein